MRDWAGYMEPAQSDGVQADHARDSRYNFVKNSIAIRVFRLLKPADELLRPDQRRMRHDRTIAVQWGRGTG